MSNSGLVGSSPPPLLQTDWRWLPTPGSYFPSNLMTTVGVSAAAHANFISWTPFVFPRLVDISAIGVWLTTAGAGGTQTCNLGLYDSHPDLGAYRPGALMVDAGTLDLTATTGWREIAIQQTLQANRLYWAAFVHGLTTTAPVMWGPSGTSGVYASFGGAKFGFSSGWPTNNGGQEYVIWSISYSAGPLPANAPATLAKSSLGGLNFPIPALKVKAT